MDLQEPQDPRERVPRKPDAVARAATVGILLSSTGPTGTLCFGGWALADRLHPFPAPATA